GLVKAAARAATREAVRRTIGLPERGEQDLRIGWVKGYVNRSGLFIFVEDFLPGLAAIKRVEDSTFGVWSIGMTEGGDKDPVRIARIDDDTTDVPGLAEADIRPCPAGVR